MPGGRGALKSGPVGSSAAGYVESGGWTGQAGGVLVYSTCPGAGRKRTGGRVVLVRHRDFVLEDLTGALEFLFYGRRSRQAAQDDNSVSTSLRYRWDVYRATAAGTINPGLMKIRR